MGITRKECRDFLQKQGNYTITRPFKKVVNKPILAKTPNERWGMDICDLSNYSIRLLWGDHIIPILNNGRYINATNMSRQVYIGLDYCFSHLLSDKHLKIMTSTILGAGKGLFAVNKKALENVIIFKPNDLIIDYNGDNRYQ